MSTLLTELLGTQFSGSQGTIGDAIQGTVGSQGTIGSQGIQGSNNGIIYSDGTPSPLGTAAAGISTEVSRSDHVHPLPGIPVLTKTAPHTLVATDNGYCISTDDDVTVNNGLPAGTTVTVWNDSGSDISIIQDTGMTLYWTQDGSTGNVTLASRGEAVIHYKTTSVGTVGGSGLS